MARWQIRYSQEVDNYFEDNGMLVKELYLAVRDMADNDGYPISDYQELERIEIRFDAHSHTIIYERWQTRQMIRIVMIKPD